eukprot:scaffold442_cov397-Prasinococcus_capsulatus_cf.AAC.58
MPPYASTASAAIVRKRSTPRRASATSPRGWMQASPDRGTAAPCSAVAAGPRRRPPAEDAAVRVPLPS